MNQLPTLDYVSRLVEANRAHRVSTADATLVGRSRYWIPGVLLDQGSEGACVGFGCAAEALASPVRWRPVDPDTHGPWATLNPAQRAAFEVYNRAKEIDEWEGVNYDGTSVRAGMLVGRERGWWTGFNWAFNMTELRAALEHGPVVIGVAWHEEMYETDADGKVVVAGPEVGGHCLILTGYTPNWHRKGPHYRWRNSWGRGYGINGTGYIAADDLDRILFQAGGEAAVPRERAA